MTQCAELCTPCVIATSLSSILDFKATSLKQIQVNLKITPSIFVIWFETYPRVSHSKTMFFSIWQFIPPTKALAKGPHFILSTGFVTVFETVFACSVFGGIFAFDSDLVSDSSTTAGGMSARALESLSLPAAPTKNTWSKYKYKYKHSMFANTNTHLNIVF